MSSNVLVSRRVYRVISRVQRDIDPQESSGLGEMLISLRGKLVTLHVADVSKRLIFIHFPKVGQFSFTHVICNDIIDNVVFT